MEETTTSTPIEEKEEKSRFPIDLATIYRLILLNWKWFVLTLIICLGSAAIYLRYTTPMYKATAKILIKDMDRVSRSLKYTNTLGTFSNSTGMDNEIELLTSRTLAEEVVRDLKLYTTYYSDGKVKDGLYYKDQPITVDLDPAHLDMLPAPINLEIIRQGNKYQVTGTYTAVGTGNNPGGSYNINTTLTYLPATINTKAGILTFEKNTGYLLPNGSKMKVSITTPKALSYKYKGSISIVPSPKASSIAIMSLVDENVNRASDYLQQLVIDYNRQANEDKNEISRRTEEFINNRLEKINAELGATEGQLESFKKRNSITSQTSVAGLSLSNADTYSQKLSEANTQVQLMNSIQESMKSGEKYQTLPANVGISDATINQMIDKYNTIALERNRLLRSASESSPTITPLTSQLDDLSNSINRAMDQAKKNFEIQRNAIASQYGKYQGQVQESPEQERILTQIGRQQEVKSGLYLILLQKREENSISLAATADKGKLIDLPEPGGMVSPNKSKIMLTALFIGLLLPAIVILIIQLLRFRIEGHDDVEKLTKLPIIADVAVASETAKTKANIVVHENQNDQMEEVYRLLRTNLQFTLKEHDKVVLFTSTTSGEGKTFNAANLSVSFALLGKRTILVGLDIRKPRLAELFEINDHQHGITTLLAKEDPTWEEVKSQIIPSGINNNLELLMAGPIPPNPSELVARRSLDIVMKLLREHYDYILIDSAPVGLVTDTIQIGRIADATVYVCRADFTPKDSFVLINSLAKEKKLPNMSIVLNGIDMSKKKYGYYYGYGKYGRYGRYGRNSYSGYGTYGSYGAYGHSHYSDKNDTSVKL